MGVGNSGRLGLTPFFCVLLSLVATDALAQMDEITVTARQREQNLQEVPVAVSAFTAEDIDRLNIDEISKLAKYNASLIFDQGFASQDTRITLRGLAPTRGRQNVAVLIDGIDITTGQAIQTNGGGLLLNPRLFDLERIEVLKGPQNALFGRSAFAGAINYITKKPGDVLDGNVFTDIGDNGQFELRAGIRGPLTDGLSLGLNFASWNHDGYYDNSVTGSSVGGVDGKGFSGTIVWEASDRLSASLYTSYTDEDIDQSPYFAIAPTTPVPIPASAIGTVISPLVTTIDSVRGSFPNGNNTPVTLSENPRTGNDYPGTDLEVWRTTLTVNAQVTEGMELVSLTHYANTDSDSFEDSRREGSVSGIGTTTGPRSVGGEFAVKDNLKLFSQELRLQSFGNDVIDWAVGGLLWSEDQNFEDLGVNCLANAAGPFPAGDCAAGLASIATIGERYGDPWDREVDHYSVYATVEWQMLEQWRLLLEARYTSEDTKITGPNRAGDPTTPADDRPRAIDPRGLPPPFGQFPATLSPQYNSITESESDTYWSPKVTLQWDPTDNMMYYFSVAGTEKPAGISVTGALTGFDPAASKFDSEELVVWELGAKTSWLDNSLVLNGAVYYQDFDDKLLTSQRADASGILFPAPVNASGAEVWGVELDAVWQALEWLSFTASYTYLDTEYNDYTQLSAGPAPIADAGNCTVVTDAGGDTFCDIDLSDNELEFAPENSFVFGTQLRAGFFDTEADWFVESDVVYQDERWTSAANTVKLDEYTVVDLRAGLATDSWEAMFYVDNVFDEDALQSTFANTFNEGANFVFSPPVSTFVLPLNQTPILPDERSYGLRVTYRFSGN